MKSPQQIAREWYSEEEIARGIQQSRTTDELAFDIPGDIYSPEFACWMTEQYRLAMAKGIQLERDIKK